MQVNPSPEMATLNGSARHGTRIIARRVKGTNTCGIVQGFKKWSPLRASRRAMPREMPSGVQLGLSLVLTWQRLLVNMRRAIC
jgi:hypothetical protein